MVVNQAQGWKGLGTKLGSASNQLCDLGSFIYLPELQFPRLRSEDNNAYPLSVDCRIRWEYVNKWPGLWYVPSIKGTLLVKEVKEVLTMARELWYMRVLGGYLGSMTSSNSPEMSSGFTHHFLILSLMASICFSRWGTELRWKKFKMWEVLFIEYREVLWYFLFLNFLSGNKFIHFWKYKIYPCSL